MRRQDVLITVTGSFHSYAGAARYAVECRKPDEEVRPEQFARHFPPRASTYLAPSCAADEGRRDGLR